MAKKTRPNPDLIKRLQAFAKEARNVAADYARLGQDDNSYDALALAVTALAMSKGLKEGTTPFYPTYAGPLQEGMEDCLEKQLTPEVAERWLGLAKQALADIS
jgi:hypothetical protein